MVGEEDFYADFGVYLLEDVAADEQLRAGEDGEAVLETVSSELGQFWQGLKMSKIGIQSVFLRKRDLLPWHQLLSLFFVGGEF